MKVKTSELTQKQKEILAFVLSEIYAGNPPPTQIEIACKFNFSSANAAREHLKAIERKGYIKLSNQARGIKLLTKRKTFDKWLSDNSITIRENGSDELYHWMKKAYNAGLAGGIS